jgi:hypothetical protein
MSRASQSQPVKQQVPAPLTVSSATTTPAAVPMPRRKRPWLLALAILLLGGWLAFLAFMAFGL